MHKVLSGYLLVVLTLPLWAVPGAFAEPASSMEMPDEGHRSIEFHTAEIPGSVGGGFEPHICAGMGYDGREWLYVDSPTGWLGGQSGNLWISKDHGETWEEHPYGRNAGGSGDSYTAIAKDGTIYYTDLYLWSSTIDTSKDGGETWIRNPLATVTRMGDRQWLQMGPTVATLPFSQPETLYMIYNDIPLGLIVQRSQWSSRGLFWTPGNNRLPVASEVGSRDHFAVDPNDGTLYLPNKEGGGIVCYVSDDGADSFTRYDVLSPAQDPQNIFIAADVDPAGNVYLTWCTQAHVFLGISTDKGVSWRVEQVTDTNGTRVFPWVVAGDPGRVALTWYDTPDTNGSSEEKTDAVWDTMAAITTDALADNVTFLTTPVMEDVHTGAIRVSGTGGDSDRDLGDFFTCDVDEFGRLIMVYGVDGDDGPNARQSAVYFSRQSEGPFLYADSGPVAIFENDTRGLSLSLDASRSYDMNGRGITDYLWEFGDGTNGTGVRTDHRYDRGGAYEVTLRVVNTDGMIATARGTVVVSAERGGIGVGVLVLVPIGLIAAGAGVYLYLRRRKAAPDTSEK